MPGPSHKRTLSVVADTWPHQHIHTESLPNPVMLPSAEPAAPWPLFIEATPTPPPDANTRPPPCPLTVVQCILSKGLQESEITKWQEEIRNLPVIKDSHEATIQGPTAPALVMFLVKVLNCLAREAPVVATDHELGVTATIPSIYSLLQDDLRFTL